MTEETDKSFLKNIQFSTENIMGEQPEQHTTEQKAADTDAEKERKTVQQGRERRAREDDLVGFIIKRDLAPKQQTRLFRAVPRFRVQPVAGTDRVLWLDC